MVSLKSLARTALHQGGGLRAVRALNRRALRILMYHSFGPWKPGLTAALEKRCEHLRACYHPVSLTDVARAWRNGEPLPPNALAITVDDGYRDFYEIAYPVFARFGLPVTVYLVSGFMDGTCWLWPDLLRYAVDNTRRNDALDFTRLSDEMKRMPNAERRCLCDRLPELFDVALPPEPPPQFAPLTWDSVREMASNGIEFGAHTKTHPILSRLAGESELRDEIEGSKRRIEEMLDQPVRHFCYPNGRPEDISEAAIACVQKAGFETAVVTDAGFNYAGADLYRLKRIPADPEYPDFYFQESVAGVSSLPRLRL